MNFKTRKLKSELNKKDEKHIQLLWDYAVLTKNNDDFFTISAKHEHKTHEENNSSV